MAMHWVSAEEAVRGIPRGARVVLPHGCVEPQSLFEAIGKSPGHPENPPILYTGLQFGEYGFLGDGLLGGRAECGGLGPGYRFVTWQVGPRIRGIARQGGVGFLPARFRDLPRLFGPGGALAADVAIVQCAPPQAGQVNLGISCAIFPAVLDAARLVIAEVHPDMPRTAGHTAIPVERIDVAVEATAPLGTLAPSPAGAVERAIVDQVLRLIPEGAWVQLGVGAVPEAILERLAEIPGVNLHSGMLTDTLGAFLDVAGSGSRIRTGEVEGSLEMYRRAASDPRVVLLPTSITHDLRHLASLERFVSVNSAIEVDLTGQVNAETIDGHQVSGVGGSLDFVEGARYSTGGVSILALPATARGRSRIVPRLREGAVVTVPRFAVDVVVTEHGAAKLSGLDLEQRAEALIEIAAPQARTELRESARRRTARSRAATTRGAHGGDRADDE